MIIPNRGQLVMARIFLGRGWVREVRGIVFFADANMTTIRVSGDRIENIEHPDCARALPPSHRLEGVATEAIREIK